MSPPLPNPSVSACSCMSPPLPNPSVSLCVSPPLPNPSFSAYLCMSPPLPNPSVSACSCVSPPLPNPSFSSLTPPTSARNKHKQQNKVKHKEWKKPTNHAQDKETKEQKHPPACIWTCRIASFCQLVNSNCLSPANLRVFTFWFDTEKALFQVYV